VMDVFVNNIFVTVYCIIIDLLVFRVLHYQRGTSLTLLLYCPSNYRDRYTVCAIYKFFNGIRNSGFKAIVSVTSCELHDSFLSKRSGHRHDSWGDRVRSI